MRTAILLSLTTALGVLPALRANAQNSPYTRIEFSLSVPWTLYFIFLLCVTIPFVIMMLLAWQRQPDDDDSGGES